MSRAPGVPGIIDVRSASLLQEYVLTHNPCAPGANRLKRNTFNSKPRGEYNADAIYDTHKSWVTVIAAMFIISTVVGIFHATFLFIPRIQLRCGIGMLHIVLITVLAFAIFIKLSTAACYCIKAIGHRLTVTFGLVIFFIGIIAPVFDDGTLVSWYLSCFLMAIGASFAYTTAMCIASDYFRRKLSLALAIVSIAGPLGILVYYLVTHFLLKIIGYKFTLMVLATIVLVVTGLGQAFSKARRCARELHPFDDGTDNEKRIRDCVKKGVQGSARVVDEDCEDPDHEKSCLCVCVCDISLWSDFSFLLWALVSMMAVLPFLIPYLFIMAYAYDIGTKTSIAFICWLCTGSIVTRFAMIQGENFTFVVNRTIFQIGLIVVGVLYIALIWAVTYGWILVWCIAIGAMEGVISVVISRLTLLTIPRKWITSSWSCTLWFHAFGVALGPLLFVSIWWWTKGYLEPFIVIAITQFIGAILATLLPDEENEWFEADVVDNTTATNNRTVVMAQGPATLGRPQIAYTSHYATNLSYGGSENRPNPSSYIARTFASFRSNAASSANSNYRCCCPICKKYGCIPGCTPCTPGGLSQAPIQRQTCVQPSPTSNNGQVTAKNSTNNLQPKIFTNAKDPAETSKFEQKSRPTGSNFEQKSEATGSKFERKSEANGSKFEEKSEVTRSKLEKTSGTTDSKQREKVASSQSHQIFNL